MNKTELKKILRPLIKECIKEVIFEEGVLSNIVSEVASGMQAPLLEASRPAKTQVSSNQDLEIQEKMEKERQLRIKRLNETMKTQMNVDVFSGTKEIPSEANVGSPLSGVDPGDSGVDISGILGLAGNKWQRLIGE